MANGYCVKCKAPREIKDPRQITMKNGRPATQGTCPVCGTKIFKIGAPAQAASGGAQGTPDSASAQHEPVPPEGSPEDEAASG